VVGAEGVPLRAILKGKLLSPLNVLDLLSLATATAAARAVGVRAVGASEDVVRRAAATGAAEVAAAARAAAETEVAETEAEVATRAATTRAEAAAKEAAETEAEATDVAARAAARALGPREHAVRGAAKTEMEAMEAAASASAKEVAAKGAAAKEVVEKGVATRAAAARAAAAINQSIKGPHNATHGQGDNATHGQGEAASQHHHRGQQTMRHEVTQAWGAVHESQQHIASATHSFSTPLTVACNETVGRSTSSGASSRGEKDICMPGHVRGTTSDDDCIPRRDTSPHQDSTGTAPSGTSPPAQPPPPSQTRKTQSHSAPTPLKRPMLTSEGRPRPRVSIKPRPVIQILSEAKNSTGGAHPDDLDCLVRQTGVDRNGALAALAEAGGDLIRAIAGLGLRDG